MIFLESEAVVLKSIDYSETSKIVTFYTRDLGKIKAITKGARRKKNDFFGRLEPISRMEVVIIKGHGDLHTLKECSPLCDYSSVRSDFNRLTTALYFISLTDETQPLESAEVRVFALLVESLEALDENAPIINISYAFQLRLVEYAGRLPRLDQCASCGKGFEKSGSDKVRVFDNQLYCSGCVEQGFEISRGTLRIIQRLGRTAAAERRRLRITDSQKNEADEFFGHLFHNIADQKMRSPTVLKAIWQKADNAATKGKKSSGAS